MAARSILFAISTQLIPYLTRTALISAQPLTMEQRQAKKLHTSLKASLISNASLCLVLSLLLARLGLLAKKFAKGRVWSTKPHAPGSTPLNSMA
jgi:hypothetical protein